ncbi:MAG: radical SAM protein [Kiritimatiellae bacterium]|nr:radical SAM protein [Kiritimatiellia bacterium]
MLSYRCTSTCRHCLSRCSPDRPDEWMTLDMAETIFTVLKKESYLQSIHIAGGEPTLKWPLLLDVIRLSRKMHIPVEYMETNASWCKSRTTTQKKMHELKEAGLTSLLVSVSMFHNEFVAFSHTRNCVEIAREVFGNENVILYLPHMYHLIAEMPGDGKHSLEDFCDHHGIRPGSLSLLKLYDVVPSGRAVSALRHCYQKRSVATFSGQSCRNDLLSTTHFHIDHEGNLFTGCCAGIAQATVPDLHPSVLSDTHPVFSMLCTEGPFGLMETSGKEHGFKPRHEGYVSKCALCLHVREHLSETGKFHELRPSYFYSE